MIITSAENYPFFGQQPADTLLMATAPNTLSSQMTALILVTRDGELRLSIMASIAQEESHKISKRIKWGMRRKMEDGVVIGTGVCMDIHYRPMGKSDI